MQLKELSFEIIQRCPNNCIYCSSNSNYKAEHIIQYSTYKRVIDEAIELGLSKLCISGGEPFLHPDLIEFVEYAKKRGLEVYIYTSGIIFNTLSEYDSIDKSIFEKLKNTGLDRIIYNVQSSEEDLYDYIMGTKGCFSLMKNSIKNSIEVGLFSELHIVPMKLNYALILRIIEMAKQLGVNKISFLRLVLQGRGLINKHLIELSEEMKIELNNVLQSLSHKYNGIDIRIGVPLSDNNNGCNASFGKLIIRYDGAVFPCEAFKYINIIGTKNLIRPDNIKYRSIKDIYTNSDFLNILRSEIKDFRKQKLECESCPAQWRLSKISNL